MKGKPLERKDLYTFDPILEPSAELYPLSFVISPFFFFAELRGGIEGGERDVMSGTFLPGFDHLSLLRYIAFMLLDLGRME